jgi:hypothetical protein
MGGEAAQEIAHRGDDLPVTLTVRVRHVDMPGPLGGEPGDGHPVERAVVALAEPRVLIDRDPAPGEGNLRRLYRPCQIGNENRRDRLAAMTLAKHAGEIAALHGQPPRQPARRELRLVIRGQGMRLEDNCNRHHAPRLSVRRVTAYAGGLR